MEKLDKKNVLYIGGAVASVAALAWLWAQHSAASAAAQQQAVDQANNGTDPATAAYEAALGDGGAATDFGATSSLPVSSGSGSGDDLTTALPALIAALGLGNTTSTANTVDYSSQIAALYQQDLNRAPETAGTAYYNSLLNSGTSLSQVAQYIAASPEAKADNAASAQASTTNYISSLFSSDLNRAPSSADISYYSGLLAGGTSQSQVAAYIAASPEAQALHSTNTTATANATAKSAAPAAAQPGAAKAA